jgi:V8-like Glu-specific endopeptidase
MLKYHPHNCIGMLRFFEPASKRTFIATGILISSNLVLTSAHSFFWNRNY